MTTFHVLSSGRLVIWWYLIIDLWWVNMSIGSNQRSYKDTQFWKRYNKYAASWILIGNKIQYVSFQFVTQRNNSVALRWEQPSLNKGGRLASKSGIGLQFRKSPKDLVLTSPHAVTSPIRHRSISKDYQITGRPDDKTWKLPLNTTSKSSWMVSNSRSLFLLLKEIQEKPIYWVSQKKKVRCSRL